MLKKLEGIKEKGLFAKKVLREKIEDEIYKAKLVLQDNSGFDGISEKTIVIIGVIVVGAAFIGAMLYLFRDTLIPQITSKIQDLFNIS